jgi:hypothetical protein
MPGKRLFRSGSALACCSSVAPMPCPRPQHVRRCAQAPVQRLSTAPHDRLPRVFRIGRWAASVLLGCPCAVVFPLHTAWLHTVWPASETTHNAGDFRSPSGYQPSSPCLKATGLQSVSLIKSRSDGDDDRSSCMSFSDMTDRLGGPAQWVDPVDDWCDLAGFDESLQDDQVCSVRRFDGRG